MCSVTEEVKLSGGQFLTADWRRIALRRSPNGNFTAGAEGAKASDRSISQAKGRSLCIWYLVTRGIFISCHLLHEGFGVGNSRFLSDWGRLRSAPFFLPILMPIEYSFSVEPKEKEKVYGKTYWKTKCNITNT